MSVFPKLNSGAVAQYPLPVSYVAPVEVIRFIDGSDQRFVARGAVLRTWHIRLSALNEDEISRLAVFFESLQGQYSLFTFPDPYSGQDVPNCRMGQNSFVADFFGIDLAAAEMWVVETNG